MNNKEIINAFILKSLLFLFLIINDIINTEKGNDHE